MALPDLLLLHGALGASAQFEPLLPLLDGRFRAHTLDFEGHGNAPVRERPFRTEHFAENVLDHMDGQALEGAAIFGYSMGGYVALYLARTRPERVRRVATLGTKLYWDAETAAREVKLLDPDKIAEKVPHFARALEARHTASGWRTVLRKTAEMMTALGERSALQPEDFGQIQTRVRVCVGDRDTTVGVDEALRGYRSLPQGELEVLPGTPHPLEKVDPARLARLLMDFFV